MPAKAMTAKKKTEGKNREIEVVIKEKIGYNCLRRSFKLPQQRLPRRELLSLKRENADNAFSAQNF